ncbi:hypothetical protein B0H14DRAFT_3508761 [Mycena olivaceomarginata]|nr:hypothetical protein B0H14DRAFT_3508761 [Mycena olivaceomarginata]
MSDSTRSKQELESAAGDAEKQDDGLKTGLARICKEHAAAVERLQDQVASAETSAAPLQELEAPVVELN